MMMLIDLVTFNPWSAGTKWVPAAHAEALHTAAGQLAALRPDDLAETLIAFDALMTVVGDKLGTTTIDAAIAAVKSSLSFTESRWATSKFGRRVNTALGLSDGTTRLTQLSALGTSAPDAGTEGMLGATILRPLVDSVPTDDESANQLMGDAIRLDLLVTQVFTHDPARNQVLRNMVIGLRSHINTLSDAINTMSARIVMLKTQIDQLSQPASSSSKPATADEQAAEIKAEVTQLRKHRARTQNVRHVLETVFERLPESVRVHNE
jgi:hypothetical protein